MTPNSRDNYLLPGWTRDGTISTGRIKKTPAKKKTYKVRLWNTKALVVPVAITFPRLIPAAENIPTEFRTVLLTKTVATNRVNFLTARCRVAVRMGALEWLVSWFFFDGSRSSRGFSCCFAANKFFWDLF